MLRQLAALTRPLPAAGPHALALAVYSGATGEHFEARESGVEGVACVDDAARASTLLYRLWAATGNDALKHWADFRQSSNHAAARRSTLPSRSGRGA